MLFGEILIQFSTSSPPKSNGSADSDEEGQEVYIKKPPNAFMLFMKEKRPNISKEFWRKGSGAVNSYLAARARVFYATFLSLFFFLNMLLFVWRWLI